MQGTYACNDKAAIGESKKLKGGNGMSEPIRVLHVLGGLSLGGAESRIMDLYRNIDREKIQFDFLVHSAAEEHFDKEVLALGGRIYRVPRFKVYNWFGYKKTLKQFFSAHKEFRAVHGHMTSTASIYLPIAKKEGIPITIAHSRSAGVSGGLKGVVTKWLRKSLKYKTDYCLACSKEAGEAVYGKKWIQKGKVEVIPNAIAAEKYVYDENVRNDCRAELGLTDKLVIGHVGSLREPKNHTFLIQVFAKIREKRQDAVLLLLGEGALMDGVKQQVAEAGLEDSVKFLGNKADVSPYYQAMDFLVFPSLYEGLPGTVIEAQTAGLRCLISDTITDEVRITDLVESYSLDKTAAEWADYVLEHCEYERRSRLADVKKAGFDIQAQIERYQEIYRKNFLLMVPMLHQGGFERICAMTGQLLKENCNISLALFSSEDMFYDVDGIELFDLNLGSRPGIVGKILNVLHRISKIKKIKQEKHINITYSFGPTANLVNALAKVNDEVWIGIRGYGALEEKGAMRLTSKRADKVICCARVMADDFATAFHPKEVVCLYNPCDTGKLRKLAEESVLPEHENFFSGEGPVIASMSREDDVKGFWHLIKSFALIKKEIPDAKLMIIGDGEFTEYKALAEELEIRDSVLFTGVQKNPFSYLKKASLYIMTSITEGFPNSLVEAMAVGVAAMSVNCKTGPAEILLEDYSQAQDQHRVYQGEYGVLLPILNPVKNLDASVVEEEERIMADEALRVLQDAEKAESMKAAAAKRSEMFSVACYVEQLEAWINKV